MRNNYHTEDISTLLGVGIGPSNLSLAALLTKFKKNISYSFFDQRPFFAWHPGLLLPEAALQTSYLEDLVTTVDPTNPYSFIAFLAHKKRLYRFIYANFRRVGRAEFSEYLSWVSQSISQLKFAEKVENINFENNHFCLRTNKREVYGRHLVLGSGIAPYLPPFTHPYVGSTVFHSSSFMDRKINFSHKRVAVIGGGQSSAEIINAMISNYNQLPSQLYWISRRGQFAQLDESPFVYELFSPRFMQYFYDLDHFQKQSLLKKYSLANDGITARTLEEIYQRLYRLELVEKRGKFFKLWPNHRLIGLTPAASGWKLKIKKQADSQFLEREVDIVILCTGYERPFPDYLSTLRDRIQFDDGQFCVNQNFSIAWNGPADHRIYVQNNARHTHGLADTSLCLVAWRSAKIINSIAEKKLYDIDDESIVIDWHHHKDKMHHENIPIIKECC